MLPDSGLSERTDRIPEFVERGEPSASIGSNPKRAVALRHGVSANELAFPNASRRRAIRGHGLRMSETLRDPGAQLPLRASVPGGIASPPPQPNPACDLPLRSRPGADDPGGSGNSRTLREPPGTAGESHDLSGLRKPA